VDKMPPPESDVPAAEDLVRTVERVVTEMQTRMQCAQHTQKQAYDRRRRHLQFTVGDHMWLSTEHINLAGSRKLKPRFIGPFTITEQVGQLAYRLALPPNLKIHNVFHVDRLKRHVEGGGDGRQPPPPVVVDPHEDPVYEVDRIVAQRGHGRRREYRVRWKGYGPEEDMWLKLPDLENA